MKELVQRLFRILEQLVDEHRQLMRDSDKQKKALIDGDVEALNRLVSAMAEGVTRIHELEATRQGVVGDIAREIGADGSEINITSISTLLDDKQARQLQTLASELQSIMEALAQTNQQNHLLTQQSLKYVRETVNLFAENVNKDTYGSTQPRQVGSHLYDVQA